MTKECKISKEHANASSSRRHILESVLNFIIAAAVGITVAFSNPVAGVLLALGIFASLERLEAKSSQRTQDATAQLS